ncbi:penicillin acylase family protein [Flavobacteriaceae bacterium]|nr:penicillin acylase family protein [Flavobacteriaceae bacterium]MDC1316347.1 penicillin acylase family protein [bacterium]MDB4024980.1 penicillin acylase family protein [Flavobacteriaceae bacterium]MDB4236644.1 penicillin acylase family protein [Flavobacteriaceae bacterium]MDB4252620.1 penicillin acylase family protein [Flavobacteriaceae bacterium]
MKIFLKIIKIVFLVCVLVFVAAWLYSRTLYPTYEGELSLENLSENVTVHFDENGVPHINAETQKDAYTALGYVHAQDRLWQMELIRRIAPGRLSEIFGDKLVETDVFFAGLGLVEDANESIAKIDINSEAYKLTIAYLDGVNQFVEEGATPIEYNLIGLKKTKFTVNDVYNVFGYMSFSFAIAQKTDPLLQEIKEKLGDNYLAELEIPIYSNTALLKSEKNPIVKASFAKAMTAMYEQLPISPFIGSNSWVIAADKTKNGKVIFANDPHIGFSQPSVWYQSHIKTPDYEMYGYSLALTPFPLLGHNRDYAYGLTMFENDDVDFYIEKNNPENLNEYETPTGFSTYKTVQKTIKIKGAPDTTFTVKISRHGPIMNNLLKQIDDQRPIAMQWIYKKTDNQILDVGYQISHAKSLHDFKEGAKLLHAPGLNMMYGDAKDNIAWIASGKLYKYRDSINTKLYLDGASGKDEILSYVDFEDNPQSINPASNYVYSSNNQPDTIAGVLYPGYYLPEDRGQRIEQLLEVKNDWTQEDVQQMIFDVTSPVVPQVIANLVASIKTENFTKNEQEALQNLKDWNGEYKKEDTAPTIYNRFLYEFLEGTFKDELGESFPMFMQTPLMKKMIAVQAKKAVSVWFDDVTTEPKETKSDIVQRSFINAISFLENQLGDTVSLWSWSKVISVEHGHALAAGGETLRKIFNVGPFSMDGGNEVINNQLFTLNETGIYKVKAGPSTRRVIDFSNIENSVSILPTGQSGNIFSKHYKDQAQKYVNGEFVKTMLNKDEIERSKNLLIFKKKE